MLLFNAHKKSSQGFTLAEVMVIVVIVGILAALAIPNLRGWLNKKQVDSAVDKVRGALSEAQREAIRNSLGCKVNLDAVTEKVSAIYVNAAGDPIDKVGKPITSGNPPISCLVTGDRNLREADLAVGFFGVAKSSVDMQSNVTSTQFSYRGTNTLGSAGTITFSASGNSSYKRCLVISSPLGIMRTGIYDDATSSCVTSQ